MMKTPTGNMMPWSIHSNFPKFTTVDSFLHAANEQNSPWPVCPTRASYDRLRAKNTEMSSKKTVKQVTNIIELYYAPVAPRERPKIVF